MNAIRHYRKNSNMTQKELAEVLGVDKSTVTKWEVGSSLPRTQLLTKIASLFGCTIDELLKDPAPDAE